MLTLALKSVGKQAVWKYSSVIFFLDMLACSRRLKLLFFVGVIFLSGLFLEQTRVIQNSTLGNQFCHLDVKKEIINSKILVDQKGEIRIEDKRYLRCLSINANATGVNKFMNATNFEGVTCKATTKRFTKAKEMPTTILQSFPGSGNTWTRHLIEEMTGFYTGSVHMDRTLKATFPGENNVTNVIVVKSHKRLGDIDFDFDKVILLIRKPYDTLLSFFSWYKTKTHTGFASEEKFQREEFVTFIRPKIKLYKRLYVRWLEDYKGKLLVQFYHDLKTDLLNSLTRIASFLGTEITLSKLWCLNKTQTGLFKRGERPEWFIKATQLDQDQENNFSKTEAAVFEACQKRQQY